MKEIYHYTSFDTFKKIIESGTIRFNSLGNVDDAEEGSLLDTQSQAPYFFVSCWTKKASESIPLWERYVDSPFAVRIGVPPDFIKPIFFKENFIENHTNRVAYVFLFSRGGARGTEFLSEVQYKEQPRIQMCKNIRGLITDDYAQNYGITKSIHWEFQEEVRYILQAVPLANLIPRPDASLYTFCLEVIWNNDPTNIEYIDMKYQMEYMKNINIMLGPSTTEEDEKDLRAYIKDKIPNYCGKISRSGVYIRK